MKTSHILAIDSSGLEVWAHKNRRLTRIDRFEVNGAEDIRRFGGWLQSQAPHTDYAILLDTPDERFQLEQLPRAGASDTNALIQRRLRQHFPEAAYSTTLRLGTAAKHHGIRQVLICALTDTTAIRPWLEIVERTSALVTRIDTPPLLLDNWFRRRGNAPQHQILLSFTRAGMRQTLFEQGRLRFNRLAAARSTLLQECLPFYSSELSQTRNYLLAQRFIGHDTELPVAILADTSDHEALRAIVDTADGMSVSFIEFSGQSKARLQQTPENSADALGFLLQQILLAPPAAHYAPPTMKHRKQLRAVGNSVLWAAGCMCAALVGAAGLAVADATTLAADSRILEQTRTSLQTQLRVLQQAQPPLPAPAPDVDAWLSALSALCSQTAAPDIVLERASMILESVPALKLEQLRWKLAEGTAKAAISVDLNVSFDAETTEWAHIVQRSIRQLETIQPRLGLAIEAGTDAPLFPAPDSTQPQPGQHLSLHFTLLQEDPSE